MSLLAQKRRAVEPLSGFHQIKMTSICSIKSIKYAVVVSQISGSLCILMWWISFKSEIKTPNTFWQKKSELEKDFATLERMHRVQSDPDWVYIRRVFGRLIRICSLRQQAPIIAPRRRRWVCSRHWGGSDHIMRSVFFVWLRCVEMHLEC